MFLFTIYDWKHPIWDADPKVFGARRFLYPWPAMSKSNPSRNSEPSDPMMAYLMALSRDVFCKVMTLIENCIGRVAQTDEGFAKGILTAPSPRIFSGKIRPDLGPAALDHKERRFGQHALKM